MKVLLLGAASSIHTLQWARELTRAGVEVVVASQHAPLDGLAAVAKIRMLPVPGQLGYFLNSVSLRPILSEEKPDILHAHYASGYATTARRSGSPFLLSVWGSDVYEFPDRSPVHRWLVRRNVMAARAVTSTSHAMADRTRLVAPGIKRLSVIPFGVDMDFFSPPISRERTASDQIVIGTVKSLSHKYGIDVLLRAFSVLRTMHPDLAGKLRLRIVGSGPEHGSLLRLADELGIRSAVELIDRVPHERVPDELAKLDIFVALSRQESFGVAVIEASANGLPAVVSAVGGLPEVVADGRTGFVVPENDPDAAASALSVLVCDADLRRRFGDAGRQFVSDAYSWKAAAAEMISTYEQFATIGRKTGEA